jgi:hypothetical protein
VANELGPFRSAGKVVVYNPDNPAQVRQVSGSGSPAWVPQTHTFSECVTTLTQSGTSGSYYANLPAGLETRSYQLGQYETAATAFSDTQLSAPVYTPSLALTEVQLDDDGYVMLEDITSLANWLRALARASTADATALSEINTGGGTYAEASDSLEAVGAQAGLITSANVTTFASLLRGTITIVQGDALLTADGRQVDFVKPSGANWPTTLAGATVTLSGTRNADKATVVSGESATFSIAGTVVTATGDSQTVRFEIPAATSLLWSVGQGAYDFRVRATGGSVNGLSTLSTGLVNVLTD